MRTFGFIHLLRIFVAAILLIGCVSVFGTGVVDPSFIAVPSKPIVSGSSMGQIVQPDGKIIIWGRPLVVDVIAKGQIARINSDGSLDNSFNYCGCHFSLSTVLLQADGKILIAGGDYPSKGNIYRLNSDGSVDNSFYSGLTTSQYSSSVMFVWAVQPDGKILASKDEYQAGSHGKTLWRLNTDGSVDSSFTSSDVGSGRTSGSYIRDMAITPDGKIYIGLTGYNPFGSGGYIRLINSNGTTDSSWEAPTFDLYPAFPQYGSITGLGLQTDGGLIVTGRFDTVNSISKPNVVRLLPAGNVDLTYTPPAFVNSDVVKVLSGGKSLVSGSISAGTPLRLYRLNIDGTQDNTFTMPATVAVVLNRFSLDSAERPVFFGQSDQGINRYFRLNINGDLDGTFNPVVSEFASVYSLARQTDGKIIVAGDFTQINGTNRATLARLNADGTLDPTFDPGTGFDLPPTKLMVQLNGKILAAGNFHSYNGSTRNYFGRINADGTLDTSFDPTLGSIGSPSLSDFTLQSDQRILIAGRFNAVNGTPRTGVARLNSDGSLDTAFNTLLSSPSLFAVVVQADGRVLIGGSFTGVEGFNRSNMARLNANGSLDQTFDAGSLSTVNSIIVQPDGKYLTMFGAGFASGLGRRNPNGSNDATFTDPGFTEFSSSYPAINTLLLLSDGNMLVGGYFTAVGGARRNNLVRLSSNGALDQLFFQKGVNGMVRAVVAQPDDKVILGGDFSRIENSVRAGIARIIPGAFTYVTLFDYDGDGKADVSVFRPSENKWYVLRSSDFGVTQTVFAISGDIPVPADYDGDGKTDFAIFRPSSGDWWLLSSINNAQIFAHWGHAGDIPRPSNFDGDGRADYILFRPAENNWYRASSANGASSNKAFGSAGDRPVTGDFDGDGKSDVAIYRPSTGDWWWQSSVDNIQRATHWGIATDIPAPADFDGDGKTDFAVYRPSTGVWYIINSSDFSFTILPFGVAEDKPVPADYDGDGKADIAVFRPSTGIWYLLQTTSGFAGLQFGVSTDIPTPNAFVP